MEFKTDALLLRAVDYGENDKIATLLTAERGKIGASLKGVKKANAKLKFAAQPFCFAEYVLAEKSGRYTVVSASLYDGFFSLREEVEKYYAASVVCEACDKLSYEGMECGSQLVCAVGALKEMTESEPAFPLVKFLLQALRYAGYPVTAEAEDSPRLFFDMESGAFSAEKGTPASRVTLFTLRRALGLSREEFPAEEKREGEKRALRLLYSYFAYQTDAVLTSLPEFIRML